MKHITLEELTEKTFGPPASTDRIEIEQELKMELLREEIKKLRKENKLLNHSWVKKLGFRELKYQSWKTILIILQWKL